MMALLLCSALLCSCASAQDTDEELGSIASMSPAAREAEYNRLSLELHRFAKRQTWKGVEKAYQRCLETGATMKLSDHFHAAHAAQSRGDMKATRDRLGRAMKLLQAGSEEEKELIDWVFAIDTTYSNVSIDAYAGAELVPEKRPFDPVQSRAIDFAVKTLAKTGSFDGKLPRGEYRVDQTPIDIRMGRGGAAVTVPEPSSTP